MPHGEDLPQNPGSLLPPGNLVIQIVGRSGCGKSTLLGQIIPQIANLASICICSTIVGNPVYARIKEYCEEEDIIYREASNPGEAIEALQEILDERLKTDDKTKWGLIIFDDFSERGGGSQRDAYTDLVVGAASRLRNYNQHFIFITQKPTGVPVGFRTNVNVRYLFTVGEQYGLRSIKGDIRDIQTSIDPELFDVSLTAISRTKHGHIMLVNKGTLQEIYVKLDDDEYQRPTIGESVEVEPQEDTRMKKLVEGYGALREKKDVLSRKKMRKIKDAIHAYVLLISHHTRRNVDEILDEIEEAYDVDLR